MIKSYPQDFDQNGTLGIKLPFNAKLAGSKSGIFNMSHTTEDQAVSNYINLLLTKKGERYMQPDFGVGLYYYLFENNTDLYQLTLKNEIQRQSGIWLPYIFNNSIEIKDYSGSGINGIQIYINFSVTETGANRIIRIFPGVDNTIDIEVG